MTLNLIRLSSVLAVIVPLQACAHMPVTSMYKLRNFSPITTDISSFRVAVRLPKTVRPQPGGVVLSLAFQRKGDKAKRIETFHLQRSADPADLEQLIALATPGTGLFALRVAPGDVLRFENFRTQIIKFKNEQGSQTGRGEMNISTRACIVRPAKPGPIYVSTFLKTGRTGDFVPLLIDVDLRAQISVQDLSAQLPPCSRS